MMVTLVERGYWTLFVRRMGGERTLLLRSSSLGCSISVGCVGWVGYEVAFSAWLCLVLGDSPLWGSEKMGADTKDLVSTPT